MFKGLFLSAAVLIGLAGLADRGLAALAGNAVGEAIARSEGLSDEPDVTFHGFPFLTQAARGRYDEVDVEARDVRLSELSFAVVTADLRGIEVSIGDALSGEVTAVPLTSGTATVELTYADLNAYLDSRPGSPRASASGDGQLLVRSSVGVPGRGSVPVEGTGSATVGRDGIVVKVASVRAQSGAALPAAVAGSAAGRLSFTIPTAGLPFGITVREVAVERNGLRFGATAQGMVIRAR
ncbi:MAG TPA: DUF2993 domain-containing protein [Mycobacteriales bacterium]|nr:DUF2993 domain-containing protein [Mycobacteriales bacterium]